MLKQIISIVFLILATMVLLAHDVIPHHHHDDHICIEHQECSPQHVHSPANSENNTDNKDACCFLADQLIYKPSHPNQQKLCPCSEHIHHSDFDSLLFLAGSSTKEHLQFTPLPFRQNPFNEGVKSLFANQTHGLRAPPIA